MAHGTLEMSREELVAGFKQRRTVIQEEWAHPLEKQWIEELISEGKAVATEWAYRDNFQCSMRKVTGTGK